MRGMELEVFASVAAKNVVRWCLSWGVAGKWANRRHESSSDVNEQFWEGAVRGNHSNFPGNGLQ